ncbi:hypothetical protein FGO68_gene12666 [Halteria grandinella]|uniref:Uncharacterized protein n=1 Tax=Halteria grandinella TaxID=5974 RepID=A0A8J8NGC2_HALGN|nr:hypothetical protein FGO68_gene12666 [Halteria grandinella]
MLCSSLLCEISQQSKWSLQRIVFAQNLINTKTTIFRYYLTIKLSNKVFSQAIYALKRTDTSFGKSLSTLTVNLNP